MRCPFCEKCCDDRVLESRSMCGGYAIRRRRECLDCSKRFTSIEIIRSDLINPFEMNKFYKYLSEVNSNQSQSETDKLERKEFKKLTERKSGYKKLFKHLTALEETIITMRFIEKSQTRQAVAVFVGISEEKVRSAELKSLKFLRNL